jgi:hypothetical protein
MPTLIIGNQSVQGVRERVPQVRKTGKAERAARLDLGSLADAWELLSNKRRTIMHAMAAAGPLAIREIARRVGGTCARSAATCSLSVALGSSTKPRTVEWSCPTRPSSSISRSRQLRPRARGAHRARAWPLTSAPASGGIRRKNGTENSEITATPTKAG